MLCNFRHILFLFPPIFFSCCIFYLPQQWREALHYTLWPSYKCQDYVCPALPQMQPLFENSRANQEVHARYTEMERDTIYSAVQDLQTLVGQFHSHEDHAVASDRTMASLARVALLLQGRPIRIMSANGPVYLSPLQTAAYFRGYAGGADDLCLKAIARLMHTEESVPNLWAFMRYCINADFHRTAEALLFEHGVPIYPTALIDLSREGIENLQLALRILRDDRVRQGLDIEAMYFGQTVLHALCSAPDFLTEDTPLILDLVERLLQAGADPNQTDSVQNSVLHALCSAVSSPEYVPGQMPRFCEMARLLLDAGANPRQRNAWGQTPVQLLLPMMMAPPPPAAADATHIGLRDPQGYIQGLRQLHRLLCA